MERLTFEGNFCDIAQCREVRYGSFCEDGYCSQRRVWEKLKRYEDLEEQGRLIEIPCKYGSILYSIAKGFRIDKVVVLQISVGDTLEIYSQILTDDLTRGAIQRFVAEDFGNIVFVSYDEAKAALAASRKEG